MTCLNQTTILAPTVVMPPGGANLSPAPLSLHTPTTEVPK